MRRLAWLSCSHILNYLIDVEQITLLMNAVLRRLVKPTIYAKRRRGVFLSVPAILALLLVLACAGRAVGSGGARPGPGN